MNISLQSARQSLTRVSMIGTLMLIVVGTALAGTGKFEPDANGGGKFNFCVSVRFNATEAQLQIIRRAFEDASQIIADATDGHHRFGTINIVNNSGASEEAEFWVPAAGGRAVGTYGQFGKKGQHVMLFGVLVPAAGPDIEAWVVADRAYTIAHEFGHHAYGLLDEYSNRAGQMGPNISCPPPPVNNCNFDLEYCLMDGISQRGGGACAHPARRHTMNEFCVASNHDKPNSSGVGAGETQQTIFNHRSCWEHIAKRDKAWKIRALPSLPVSAPPASQPVTFGTTCGKPRVAVLIDRSGSMSTDNRLGFAKLGAEQFINSFANGSLAVVSFSISPSVAFPLTEIINDTNRNNAKAAVNALVASGPTNIGDGLLTALAQLNSQGDCPSCAKTIILLSDGEHNTGTPPESVVAQLNSAGVKLITSVVGSGISLAGESSLQNITNQTNGAYYRVSTAADATGGSFPGFGASGLVGLFMRLGSDMKGDALLKQERHLITSGQVKEVPILLETGAANATFAVTIADQADSYVLSLRTPSGVIFTGSSGPNVQFTSGPNSRVFQVTTPQPGTWTVTMSAGAIRTGKMEVLSFGTHDGVRLDAWVGQETVSSLEPVRVYATPTFDGERVTGASVTGTVIRPDGSKLPISIF
jgi:calcium-activated chloride channel regulator 4